MTRFFLIIFFFSVFQMNSIFGQVISYQEFIEKVEKNHPFAAQIALQSNKAESQVLSSKGAFDPNINSVFRQKDFGLTDYYNINNTNIFATTPSGIGFKAGYEYGNGSFLNPENVTSNDLLWYAGVKVPLLKGLITNKKNTILKQARLYQAANVFEQKLLIQSLKKEAAIAYLEWSMQAQLNNLQKEVIQTAIDRLDGVKSLVRLGDKPTIDTVEAWIQVQNRTIDGQMFSQQLVLAGANVYVFVWENNSENTDYEPTFLPQSTVNLTVLDLNKINNDAEYFGNLIDNHPVMKLYDFKLKDLDLEQKLKKNNLLPDLTVEYNLLSDYSFDKFYVQNRKWGLNVNYPILNRESRGELKLNEIKINETLLAQGQKRVELINKIKNYYTEFQLWQTQFQLINDAIDAYRQMYEAEVIKYNNGESSLFLLFSRELSLLEARKKAIEINFKLQKSKVGLLEAAAIF